MKKKILICTAILLGVFLIGISAGTILISSGGINISTGRCLITDNGSCILISRNSPIKLNAPDYDSDFAHKLSDGDKILVIHSAVAESYPGSTLAYYVLKTGEGTYEDLPENVLSQLTELSWINTNLNTDRQETVLTQNVSIQKPFCNLSIDIPDGWTYSEIPTADSDTEITLDLYKETSPEDKITIQCKDSFAVCGTGLTTQDIIISGYKAHKGIYDNNPAWDYIVFEDTPGYYVVYNSIDKNLWNEYATEVTAILNSIKIAEGIVFREDALHTAKAQTNGEYISSPCEFSTDDGIWTFTFRHYETEEKISIDSKGILTEPKR